MTQNKFEKLVSIYRAIDFVGKSRKGTLIIADEAQLLIAREVLSSEIHEYGIQLLKGNVDSIRVGEAMDLEIGDPKLAIGIVALNLDDLLVFPKARIAEPTRYFIISEKFCVTDTIVPDLVGRYRSVLKLIELFRNAAAYLDENNCELIFIQDGKFEIPTIFNASDLLKTDVASIAKLIESFNNDTHKEQKLSILAKSIHSISNATKPRDRFCYLLEHFPELFKSFSEGYRLFVADFSYDKIVNQLEVAKLEEVSKIHKTFADVQNQILGIPVATIVVATQMKTATKIGYEFWVNTAVLVGCWVFAILCIFVLRNQLHTLKAIGNEINRKKQQMLKDYKSVEDLISKSFPFLESRLRTQKVAFYAVDIIIVAGLILSNVVYFNLTNPAYDWFNNAISIVFTLSN